METPTILLNWSLTFSPIETVTVLGSALFVIGLLGLALRKVQKERDSLQEEVRVLELENGDFKSEGRFYEEIIDNYLKKSLHAQGSLAHIKAYRRSFSRGSIDTLIGKGLAEYYEFQLRWKLQSDGDDMRDLLLEYLSSLESIAQSIKHDLFPLEGSEEEKGLASVWSENFLCSYQNLFGKRDTQKIKEIIESFNSQTKGFNLFTTWKLYRSYRESLCSLKRNFLIGEDGFVHLLDTQMGERVKKDVHGSEDFIENLRDRETAERLRDDIASEAPSFQGITKEEIESAFNILIQNNFPEEKVA